MKTLQHSIDIPAPVSEVWEVLTAGDEYAAWNPFMTRLSGRLAVGERLVVTIRPGPRAMTFKPTVVALEPARLIRWQGRLGVRGIFDGEHELRLQATPDGTRFTQHETFSGLLVPLMRGVLADTLRGFAAMNQALRDRTMMQEGSRR
jgi:hypothetical protein